MASQNGWLALLDSGKQFINRQVTGVTAILLTVVAVIAIVGVISWSVLEILLTVGGFVTSIISLIIMLRIARDQTEVLTDQGYQIESLDRLNDELRARKAARERVQALFLTSDNRQFTCVMPVEYRRRPLPTIAAGDYYAWHVVQNFVGDVAISMHLTNRARSADATVKVVDGNVIYLCSPQANPPLDGFAPWTRLIGNKISDPPDDRDPEELKRGVGRLRRINLPVWFGCRKKPVNVPESESGVGYWEEKIIFYGSSGDRVGGFGGS